MFADFYEDLYATRNNSEEAESQDQHLKTLTEFPEDVQRFSVKELKDQLAFMKKGKAADQGGLVVEMLQLASDDLLGSIAALFDEVLFSCEAPCEWKKSRISVLFKKGDPKMPGNYRPITLLPILYKLFSRLVLHRIRPTLEAAQTVDQAGFRSGFSCEDHLFTAMLLAEIMLEFQMPLCIVNVCKTGM